MEILSSRIPPSSGPCLVAGTKITSILNAFKPNKEKTFEGKGERTKSAYVNGRWSNTSHSINTEFLISYFKSMGEGGRLYSIPEWSHFPPFLSHMTYFQDLRAGGGWRDKGRWGPGKRGASEDARFWEDRDEVRQHGHVPLDASPQHRGLHIGEGNSRPTNQTRIHTFLIRTGTKQQWPS